MRDGVCRFAETLADDLPGEIDIGAVFKIDVDDGKPEVRSRTDFLNLGKSGHGRFNRIGDIPLHFFGGKTFGLGEYLNQ